MRVGCRKGKWEAGEEAHGGPFGAGVETIGTKRKCQKRGFAAAQLADRTDDEGAGRARKMPVPCPSSTHPPTRESEQFNRRIGWSVGKRGGCENRRRNEAVPQHVEAPQHRPLRPRHG